MMSLRESKSKNTFKIPQKPQNINDEKQFLFIHIPKNAGTSLGKALGINDSYHYFWRDYEAYFEKNTLVNLFRVAFVRHPYDRFISLFNYARLEISYYHNNIKPSDGLYGPHADYKILNDITSLRDAASLLVEGELKHGGRWNHWKPQVEWLKNSNGEAELPEFLGRFEELERDFLRLKKQLQLPGKLSYLNNSSREGIELDSETKRVLQDYYAEDFSLFKYIP